MRMLKIFFYCALSAAVLLPSYVIAAGNDDEGARLGKPCAGCHATNGYAPGAYVARIAGQNTEYLAKVMKEFAAGNRKGSVEMSIIAKGYDEAGLKAISEYYGGKKWKDTVNATDKKMSAAGKITVEKSGCFDCHVSKGVGAGETPRIAGQNKMYLLEALKRYKDGQIASDEMAAVKDLTEKQLAEVSEFLATLK